MRFNDWSIKWKILIIAMVGPIAIAAVFAYQRINEIRDGAQKAIINKSQVVILMAEATREQGGKNLELGILKPLKDIEPAKILNAVPVVSAMQTAKAKAASLGYQFRAPKISPRNPANAPDPVELSVLQDFEKGKTEDRIIVEKDQIRYLRPVRLTTECLFCHGDPKGSVDPTGGVKEGWREGEIHGAFEVISSLDEANRAVLNAQISILTWTSAILFLIGVAAWFLMKSNILTPLKTGGDLIRKLAAGDMTQTATVSRKDEFGDVTENLNSLSAQLRGIFKNFAEKAEHLLASSKSLNAISNEMASGAEVTLGKSNTVAAAAEEMSANMNSVAAAVEEASTNVRNIAASVEEMILTVNEISKSTEKAAQITGEAVAEAESASASVDELGQAAQKIGRVTETITEISEQTNLLALNATIEAARAGEAGKGFAVVANEIKELAKQTAKATDEIKNRIEGIQSSTRGTVGQIGQISTVIHQVNEIVTTIAKAIEAQSSTTREIAANVAQASQGFQEVAENVAQSSMVSSEVAKDIAEVNMSASEISNSGAQVNLSAKDLSGMAEDLNKTIARFVV